MILPKLKSDSSKQNIRIKPETRVKPEHLPENFIETLSIAFKEEADICTVLSVYSYLFRGMKIDEIRDRIIVPDDGGPRIVSREYIRRRIEIFMEKIEPLHYSIHGDCTIAPLIPERNLHPVDRSVRIDTIVNTLEMEEENIIDDQTKAKTKFPSKKAAILTEEEITKIEST